MGINLIAMLTNHDKTVPGAKSVFEENRSAKTGCWGFKDVGIEPVSYTHLRAHET